MKIAEIFETKIEEKIEPVIKVGEIADETKVAQEISSFVVTPTLEKYFDDFFEHYTDSIRKNTSEIGVWISGYFGSGKSHLAKIISQVAENRLLDNVKSSVRFEKRVPESSQRNKSIKRSLSLLEQCNTKVLGFNLNTIADARDSNLAKLLLSQYYKSKGFGNNVIFAKVFESELEKINKIKAFYQSIKDITGKNWDDIKNNQNFYKKKIYQSVCEVAPELFHSIEEVEQSLINASIGELFNIEFLIKTILEDLEIETKRTGVPQRFFLVLDETGQWIEDNHERLVQLTALVEEAAKEGKGKIWIIVTTHEDMGSVYKNAHALDADVKKTEGRFKFKFSLTTENIELVLEDRIFKKKLSAKAELQSLYQANPGELKGLGELENTQRNMPDCSLENFSKFYPFFPYQIHLIPEVVKTLRSSGGRTEQLTGSTRTLLAITQDIIRGGKRDYLNSNLGLVVSFDEVYRNLMNEGEISSDIRRDISSVIESVPNASELTVNICEVLYLISEVNFIPKTEENISRLLVPSTEPEIGILKRQVQTELIKLKNAKIIAPNGDEWEFLTGERRNFEEQVDTVSKQLRYQEREVGLGEFINTQIIGFENVPFEGYDFPVKIQFDSISVSNRGYIDVKIISGFQRLTDSNDIKFWENESLKDENKHTFFIFSEKDGNFLEKFDRYLAMKEIVDKWKKEPNISEESKRLVEKKDNEDLPRLKRAVEASIKESLKNSFIIYKGNSRKVAIRTNHGVGESIRIEIGNYFGSIYTKYKKVPVRIANEQKDIESVLKGLSVSSDVKKLNLYDTSGQINQTAPLISELRIYLNSKQNIGNRIIAKDLLEYFEKPEYGWDPNSVRVGLAAMFRAGLIKILIEKKPYTNPNDSDLVSIFRNKKEFLRVEIVLEDSEISPDVLTKIRAMLIKVTGVKKIDETPSDLTAASLKHIEALVEKIEKVNIWSSPAGFPLSDLYSSANSEFVELVEQKNPTHHIKHLNGILDVYETYSNIVNEIYQFYTTYNDKFLEVRNYSNKLSTIKSHIPKDSKIALFIDNFQSGNHTKTIYQKDVWQHILDSYNNSLTESDQLKVKWKTDSLNALYTLKIRIEQEKKNAFLTSDEIEIFESAFIEWTDKIENEAEIINLAFLIQLTNNFVSEQIQSINDIIDSKENKDIENSTYKKVKKVKIVKNTQVIHSLDEWEAFVKEVDGQIRSILTQGDEVELN